MKRPNSWSDEHSPKRCHLPPTGSNGDNTLAPSLSIFKRHSNTQKQDTPDTQRSPLSDPKTSWILDWIPQPPTGCDGNISDNFDDACIVRNGADFMSAIGSGRKRSRLGSSVPAWDLMLVRLVPQTTRGPPIIMPLSPDQEDVALYQLLLQHKTQQVPTNTLFDYPKDFIEMLQNNSETQILCFLHFLLMPSARELCIRGQKHLQHVNESINDSWLKADLMIPKRPQPDHSRCLRLSAFDEEERQKLQNRPVGALSYAVRDHMYFPYLICEIKEGLELADLQNMHSTSITLRSLVQLAKAAGTPEKVHGRVLCYSISHNLRFVQIYGHYPELQNGGQTKYFRCDVAHFHIWSEGNQWKCYNFVQGLDAEFLPKYIALVKELLAGIESPGPFKVPRLVRSSSGQNTPPDSGGEGSPYFENNDNQELEYIKMMHQDVVRQLQESRDEAKEREEAARQREEAARQREEGLLQDIRDRDARYQKLVEMYMGQRQPTGPH